jgi:hypothetical protein
MPERAGRKVAGLISDFRFAILDLETGRRQRYGLIKLGFLGFWFGCPVVLLQYYFTGVKGA